MKFKKQKLVTLMGALVLQLQQYLLKQILIQLNLQKYRKIVQLDQVIMILTRN